MDLTEFYQKVRDFNVLNYDDFINQRIKAYNDEPGTLKGYNCPVCLNKGNVMKKRVDDNGNVSEYLEVCECVQTRKAISRGKKSGLGTYLNKQFTDFKTTQNFQFEMYNKANQFVNNDDVNNNWFVVLGQVGCGKTLLASIVANDLLNKGNTVLCITWTDFIGKLKRDIMDDDKKVDVSHTLDNIKNVPVLFIDELLKKYNETDLKYIVEIINYRYTNKLPTIITSEKHIGQLLDIDEATFSRVVEMAGDYLIDIPTDKNKNYRLRGLSL